MTSTAPASSASRQRTRLFHGGPAGLRGQILPASVVTGVPFARSWVCVTTDLRLARYFAAGRASQFGWPLGVVYLAWPDGDLEPDIDMPWTWRVPSARIVGVASVVRAQEAKALDRWFYKWRPGAVRASDAALGLTGWRKAAARGEVPGVLPECWNRSRVPVPTASSRLSLDGSNI